MKLEIIIYIIQVVSLVFLLLRYTPTSKIRQAHVAYLFTLIITWVVGIMVSEFTLINYPVRIFPIATRANFLFEYFLLPSMSTIFVVNYPEKKSIFTKCMYYLLPCAFLTVIEIVEERYTDILKYIHWTWYITFITLFLTFFAVRKYNKWFFK